MPLPEKAMEKLRELANRYEGAEEYREEMDEVIKGYPEELDTPESVPTEAQIAEAKLARVTSALFSDAVNPDMPGTNEGYGQEVMPAFLRALATAGKEPVEEPKIELGTLIVTKLFVTALVGRFLNGRMVHEYTLGPTPVMAHATDEMPFARNVNDLEAACIAKVAEEIGKTQAGGSDDNVA